MGLFTKKTPCAICGGKVSGLFVPKVEGQFVCKECYGTVDVSDEVEPLTMAQFQAYRQFREENQKLREQFQTTEHIRFGFFGADFVFDLEHRWFCLDQNLARTILEGNAVKSFAITEDGQLLYECRADGFWRYQSDVPERVRLMTPMIDQYRMQMEMQRNQERRMKDEPRHGEDAPPPTAPHIDLPEPFERFYIEITLNHPYWPVIRVERKGPTFDGFRPDAGNYLREYWEDVDEMERLSAALKQVAFPNVPERTEGEPAAATSTAEETTVAQLKQYKELLDQGIITEEEFSAKKRQLMGI